MRNRSKIWEQYELIYGQYLVSWAKVHLENGWNSIQTITEGEAAIPLETTRRAFGNQEKTKQDHIIVEILDVSYGYLSYIFKNNQLKKP